MDGIYPFLDFVIFEAVLMCFLKITYETQDALLMFA